ncbi:hypothetical protein N7447_007044 [Penicillium robsamsonii]|uniref:uncharacterized protein n=1 Tax=Penicillium robsamsonii TaxID=1792511 RepID=UPI0025499EAB|nr:uncharacterized protein N7447_007044 [Penicillium robsamsonii]KAJ5824704.1 hypothetical protein N7447_007044 [Penicillium robsamsonii]
MQISAYDTDSNNHGSRTGVETPQDNHKQTSHPCRGRNSTILNAQRSRHSGPYRTNHSNNAVINYSSNAATDPYSKTGDNKTKAVGANSNQKNQGRRYNDR